MFSLKHALAALPFLASACLALTIPGNDGNAIEQWKSDDDDWGLVMSMDIPDGDNFPMVAHGLLKNHKKKAHITMYGREVNYGWEEISTVKLNEFLDDEALKKVTAEAQKDALDDSMDETWRSIAKDLIKNYGEANCFIEAWRQIARIKRDNPEFKTWMTEVPVFYIVSDGTADFKKKAVPKLSTEFQAWYDYLHETSTTADEELYMQVSKIRLMRFLDSFKIDRKRYKIVTKGGGKPEAGASEPRLKKGIHFAKQVTDYEWGLDDDTTQSIQKCKGMNRKNPYDKERETCIRGALQKMGKEFVKENGDVGELVTYKNEIPDSDIKKDIKKYLSVNKFRYLVGGPLTSLAHHLTADDNDKEHTVEQAVVMLQSFDPKSNLFKVQYNHFLDPGASKLVMGKAIQGNDKLDLWLIPTEIAKVSPWTFTFRNPDTMAEAFGKGSAVYSLEQSFVGGSGLQANLFDLFCSVYAYEPDLFPAAIAADYKEDRSVEYLGVDFVRLEKSDKSAMYVVGMNKDDPMNYNLNNYLHEKLQTKKEDMLESLNKVMG
ncbi:Uu.00g040020.m01.CDS01 [Anthostomella pinea]|uniref:Uu.00g040020.m01.CDS01 n=1 Tax=Anthostomella pinea TaxID=933095 RepID=A0AAI8YBH3_9PEZI|nr:Uu.00g040020.m01.CDS01 [Anthostomella pinea]